MPLKKYNPITPTLRFKTTLDFSVLSDTDPYKPLLAPLNKKAGRGFKNQISVRRRGGGHKRLYRIVDFKRDKFNIPAVVESIEYDPNRSANIALLKYLDGERRYIIAPYQLKVGDQLLSGENVPLTIGNSLPLANIPVGMVVHNIEMQPGRGAQLARSAGAGAQILGKEEKYVIVKLPSNETRKILNRCMATLGEIGNKDCMNVSLGKAGRTRWLGRRPKVRGVVMNPVDHPHGGGEGRTSGGRHPVSPTGVPTKGYKTRKKKNLSNKFIIKRRK